MQKCIHSSWSQWVRVVQIPTWRKRMWLGLPGIRLAFLEPNDRMEDQAAWFMRECDSLTWDMLAFLEPRGGVGELAAWFTREWFRPTWDMACFPWTKGRDRGAGCLVHERLVQAYLGYGLLFLSLGAEWGSWLPGARGSVWVRGYPSSGEGAPGYTTVAPVRTAKGNVY
jgi:hypothetical protein